MYAHFDGFSLRIGGASLSKGLQWGFIDPHMPSLYVNHDEYCELIIEMLLL
jgi:hypothetical protein